MYDDISGHFSVTRYKCWPQIEKFLGSLPREYLVADVGCGNGKCMVGRTSSQSFVAVGVDISLGLLRIAASRGLDCIVADNLQLPYRDNVFDAAISVAVLHHFSTRRRRVRAIREICRVLRPHGRALLSVWAFEQRLKDGRPRFSSRDVFIPWHLQQKFDKEGDTRGKESSDAGTGGEERVFERYYHLFERGELESLMAEVEGIHIIDSGLEHEDNWYVLATSSTSIAESRPQGRKLQISVFLQRTAYRASQWQRQPLSTVRMPRRSALYQSLSR